MKKLEQFSLNDLKLRTDSEHAIVAIAREVKRTREFNTVLEVAPEAEYLAMTTGVCEALALRTILLELGIETHITIYTDSSSAKASAEKPGLMHMKHICSCENFS